MSDHTQARYILAGVCVLCLTVIICWGIHNEVNSILNESIIGAIVGIFAAAIGTKIYDYVKKPPS